MPIDSKYGQVVLEHGDIGEDEPVFVFRARDALLPKVLMYYHLFCMKLGSPREHLDLLVDTLERVELWQAAHESRPPTSREYFKRVADSGGKPTRGRVEWVDGDNVEVWVPIDGADVDDHSQAVPYPITGLVLSDGS